MTRGAACRKLLGMGQRATEKQAMVVVYGTLKEGHGNHRLMERIGGVYVGEGLTHA